ncbi:MAG TPA: toll/interleukin-1 receptor domain-containing protein [Myxococcaceae bacterium]|jgi:hypothetical protein
MKVFISYAHDDRARMLVIADAVRAAGHQVEVDEGILRGGDDFARHIEAAIGACDACVVLWSPSSAGGKPWVPAEANLALQKGKRVISVKLAECSPPLPFSTYHMLDFTKSSDPAPLLASLVPPGTMAGIARSLTPGPPPRLARRTTILAGAGVAVAVLSIGAWLAIPTLQKPATVAETTPDAGPALVPAPSPIVPAAAVVPARAPDAGRAPDVKPKPKQPPPAADPCTSLVKAYEPIQEHCRESCDLDHYPLRQDLELCRACDSARTQLQHCRGAR